LHVIPGTRVIVAGSRRDAVKLADNVGAYLPSASGAAMTGRPNPKRDIIHDRDNV